MSSPSDYSVFANQNFDPNDYANAILAGDPYPPATQTINSSKSSTQDLVAKEDISVAISKLTFAIDDVGKQIRNVVTVHHENLLMQAADAHNLSDSLISVRSGIDDLNSSIDKLRNKIHTPYESLQANVSRLRKLQQASDLLRRTSRFVVLAKRLQLQMKDMEGNNGGEQTVEESAPEKLGRVTSASAVHALDFQDDKERNVGKAALSIAELSTLLDGVPDISRPNAEYHNQNGTIEHDEADTRPDVSLRSVRVVAIYETLIEEARLKVTTEMENMVLSGLTTLNQTLLASSFQIAHNLKALPGLIQNLIQDLSHAVEDRIRNAFDMSKISKDALVKDQAANSTLSSSYKSRVRTEPTNVTAPQWTSALWARLEAMFEEITSCCIKVYTLEKVLVMKKDAISQVSFLDEAMSVLENKPNIIFWTSLSLALEKSSRDSMKASTFLQQTLSSGYLKLLRYFHEFFGKIALHTDTVYIDTYQSPETILILRSLNSIEALYLARSNHKLTEVVGHAFSGGTRTFPGSAEGIGIARTIANELDSARFDPLLIKAIAKNIVSCLDLTASRAESLAIRDRSATTLIGPSATPQQVSNAQLASCLYHCWLRLSELENEYSEAVFGILKPSLQNIHTIYSALIDPLAAAIRRELGAIIAKLHRIDFGKSLGMGGSSLYIKELTEKLAYIKNEVLSNYNTGEDGKSWIISIIKFVMRTFLLHISIVKPLGESGKLQMTTDMTELEFALNAFIAENSQNKRGGNLEVIGEEYRALRAMRQLLFYHRNQLASTKDTAGLPPLIVLHHILVRSPIPLPHSLHGWQEAEYVRWVDEHTDEEARTLIDGGIIHWEKIMEAEGKEVGSGSEYIEIARTVLRNVDGSNT